MLDYSKLPEHLRDGFKRYIENRIPPGSCVTAILENDLKGAFSQADEITTTRMADIVSFVYWELPAQSQGSPEAVRLWLSGDTQ